ncbi:hypothetical protein PybrP1_012241 [[Pythium] brassicae (nom. inval.)]|nr:hypothetical protein PybrP1_012241 [[Pythium] brassicae (nom. inval.)]
MKCFAPAHIITTLATLLATAAALSIQSSQVEAVSNNHNNGDRNDARLTLEKTWTISSAEQLQSLLVGIPGNVFVEYDAALKQSASDVVAKIVVRGDSRELVDVFEVVPRNTATTRRGHGRQEQQSTREDSVRMHLKNTDATVHGHVLTQIFVADKSVLCNLSAASTHDVVIGESVLASNGVGAAVSLSVAGSGTLFVSSSQDVVVEALTLSVAGSGEVQIVAPSVRAADDVTLSIAGSGRITVDARDVAAEKLETSLTGSGDISVQSDELRVYNLMSKVAGSGAVNLSKSGACTHQKVSIAGSGSVATGSVVCESTDVSISGRGEATVQTTDTLIVSTIASGSVKYVNSRPKKVQQSSLFAHGSLVSQAEKNEFKTHTTVPTPSHSAVEIRLELRKNAHSEDPSVHNSQTAALSTDATTTLAASPASASQAGNDAVGPVVGIAGVALVAVGALVHKHHQQHKREEYAPLV